MSGYAWRPAWRADQWHYNDGKEWRALCGANINPQRHLRLDAPRCRRCEKLKAALEREG